MKIHSCHDNKNQNRQKHELIKFKFHFFLVGIFKYKKDKSAYNNINIGLQKA